MSEDAKGILKQLLPGLLTSLIASIVVGAFASYMTGSVMLAKLETLLERAESDISGFHGEIKTIQAQRAADREALIRLEAKIDILVQRQIQEEKQKRFQSFTP